MKALILAAGSGTRLGCAAGARPKGLVEIGGRALLERQIDMLEAAGVARTCIVTGYRHADIERRLGARVAYRHNPFFAQANNMASVLFARDWMDEASLILYADLLYEPEILEAALRSTAAISLSVDKTAAVPGHALVSILDGRVRAIGSELDPPEADARFIGIAKVSEAALPVFFSELEAAAKAGALDRYYTIAFDRLAARGYPIQALDTAGARWAEIDCPEDLKRAREAWA